MTKFIPTLGNMIEEIDKILKGLPPDCRDDYAKLFSGTLLQKVLFTSKDFEEAASEYCRDTGWREPS